MLGEDAQSPLGVQLFGERSAGSLQTGDLGEPIAHLAVQPRVLERDRHVIGQQLHDLAILNLEDAGWVPGHDAEHTHHATLPPDRNGDTGLHHRGLWQRHRHVLKVTLGDHRFTREQHPSRHSNTGWNDHTDDARRQVVGGTHTGGAVAVDDADDAVIGIEQLDGTGDHAAEQAVQIELG